MRIAYLTQSYPPVVSGAAIVVKGLAEAMARRGHQVLVLTSSEHGSPYQTIKPNLTVIHFRSYRNPLRVGQSVALWPHAGILAALRQFRPDLIEIEFEQLIGQGPGRPIGQVTSPTELIDLIDQAQRANQTDQSQSESK